MTDTSSPTIWITGSTGQVGRALLAAAPDHVRCVPVARPQFDLATPDWVSHLARQSPPDVILHAGAWTAVDLAESEQQAAMSTNVGGTSALAACARDCHARLIMLSTDYVFAGTGSRPWHPDDPPQPQSVYGLSKWRAEQTLATLDPATACIVRTSWVYDAEGKNFVRTMLRLMATRTQIRVVADQFGTPTSARTLAACLWRIVATDCSGVVHFADAGAATWYDFAVAIQDIALELGLLERSCEIVPINTADYPTAARRPAFSVLDRSRAWNELNVPAIHWRHALHAVLLELTRLIQVQPALDPR